MTEISDQKSLQLPPDNLGLPYFGETSARIRDFRKFHQERHQKYGKIFKTRLSETNYIIINDSEANKFSLSNENNYFINSYLNNIRSFFGTKILIWQTGIKHKNSRKVLDRAFQDRSFDRYIQSIKTISKEYKEVYYLPKINSNIRSCQLQTFKFSVLGNLSS